MKHSLNKNGKIKIKEKREKKEKIENMKEFGK